VNGEIVNYVTRRTNLNKILILGDSHARKCTQIVKYNLNFKVEIQGIVKPGAALKSIVNTKTVESLTKNDIVILWGGSCDVGKNESTKGLNQLENFIQKHDNTNFIVMGVPHRYDLDFNSCVNEEVRVYNRELVKCLESYENIDYIEVDSNRELFTKHGLHLNSKGKNLMAMKIVQRIKDRLGNNITINKKIALKDSEKENIFNKERIVEIIQTEASKVQLIKDHISSISDLKDSEIQRVLNEERIEREEIQVNKVHTDSDPNLKGDRTQTDRLQRIINKERIIEIIQTEASKVQLIKNYINSTPDQKDREIQRACNGKRIESEEIQVIKVHTNCVLDLQENKLPTKRNRKPPITRRKDFLWIDGKINQT
jgi:hypothetical protein